MTEAGPGEIAPLPDHEVNWLAPNIEPEDLSADAKNSPEKKGASQAGGWMQYWINSIKAGPEMSVVITSENTTASTWGNDPKINEQRDIMKATVAFLIRWEENSPYPSQAISELRRRFESVR